MSTRVAITHAIEQRFERPVRLSTHWLRVRPAPQTHARITAYSLTIDAKPHFVNWVRDPFENHLARVDFPEPVNSLRLAVEFIAELEPINPLAFLLDPDAESHPFAYSAQLLKELGAYLQVDKPGARLLAWLNSLGRTRMNTIERLSRINQRIEATHRVTPTRALSPADPELVLARGSGSCWDLGWLLTMALRQLGIAARVAFGHRVFLAQGADELDSVSLHCWSEAYLPGAGWVGLDPTAGLFTTEAYVPFAAAPDALRVRPIVGYHEACEEKQVEKLSVRRLVARTVAGKTQEADVQALGRLVERDLAEQGVKSALGMSFSLVSSSHADASEWKFAGLGPTKRWAAESLLSSLRQRLAPGGVIQHGQGQWFAGDPLPRWRLGCYFRRDGRAVWPSSERLPGPAPERSFERADTARFAEALATALGVGSSNVIAAYEDPLRDLLRAPVPVGAAPNEADLADPERRRDLAQRLSHTRREVAGHVLPIGWDHAAQRWRSGRWVFRRADLYLTPGDSPIGYRLPLGSLPHDELGEFDAQLERSPFDERPPLPEFGAIVRARLATVRGSRNAMAQDRPPRTALCLQRRVGRLYVFLPPVSHLEHYLELVAAIQAASETLDLPVILEGYAPPEDHRLHRLLLEPDAGVLRATLPQSERWDERVDVLTAVYEEAGKVGLRAERVMADGRRLPPGGDARLTIAGVQPADSPFLRRPAILRGLIAYFQRHPCLSYFFAGRLIGPSGSASRPDEGRDEALYELCIGLDRLPEGDNAMPWLADRALRHLLTDPSGNLERAEIRVDQLYPPGRAGLRLGRIHIGSFETAPDAPLAALQSLLVLGLLGRAVRSDTRFELSRWGPALHDQFMLPDVLWNDLGRVIEDLNSVGYPFQLSWFERIKELRFPVLGSVQLGETTLELRSAHEPWPLLAERASAGGMARFVDMANERMQVKVSGLTGERHVLACNGHRVPLRSTGTRTEYVAGVRYKVTNPPATLHPTIPAVDALVFDLIDGWSGRAIGGCTYLPGRPEIWGPVGSPVTSAIANDTVGDPAAAPRPRLPQPPAPPPASTSGAFLPRGSGYGPMPLPPPHHSERYPYLLDLTKLSS